MKIIAILLAALTGLSLASGKPQQLTSPDQVPTGLEKSDWHSIRAAYEAGRHAIHRQENGTLTARNPGQQWRTDFDGKGFLTNPDHGQWTWGLELTGYNQQTLPPAASSLTHEGGKITCRRDAYLTEWFINDTRGLEQGWTIQSKLSPTTESLTLTLAVHGDLKAQVSPDSSSVAFQTSSGTTALTYGGLKAWDADGTNLTVRFEPNGETAIRIAVDDQTARYPITIDPIAQQAYLKASSTGAGDFFGSSVAVSGDTVIVGAPAEDSSTTGVNSIPNESSTDSGAAYVFTRSSTTWSQQAYLKASNIGGFYQFGISVAVSGDTVVVGANREASSTTGVNSAPNLNAGGSGAAYVFIRSGTTWSQQAFLKASNTGANDLFGSSVAVSGDTVVVGANQEDSSTTGVNSTPNDSSSNSGAAYVFARSGTTWSQQAYLKASNTGRIDGFGISVAVSGNTVVVGARFEGSSTTGVNSTPDENGTASGAAYVFTRSEVTWSQQAYLKAGNTGRSDGFGKSVAVAGDTVVVGAPYESSSTTGVNSTHNESATDSGAAYVFSRSGTTWSQQAYLKASNTGTLDNFGWSVAVSSDTVVVGAINEASSTTGVNSTPNESASTSGAAYVFNRSGTAWSQQAYLKASNTGEADNFGTSVAVEGDTVVVGAVAEDSSTTGVNSTPNDNIGSSGAAYIFTGFGPPPTVASISPSLGSISGGTSVTVTGTGFSAATSVTIGGAAATNVVITNSTTITCTVPPGTAGLASVLVTNPFGTNAANTLFTYVNSTPTVLALSANSIAENVAANSTVGILSTTDPDAGSSFTYSLVNGSGSTDNAAFNISGSSLRITASPNFETKSSYAVRVRTTDQGGLFFEQAFTITITNGNDAPTFAGYSLSTPYQTASSLSFGKLLTKATDIEGDALTVSAAGPGSIQGGTAVLQSGAILYTPANGFSGTDTFSATITDPAGASVIGTITVNVQINIGIGTNAPVLTVMSGGRMGIGFHGIPRRSYQIQRSTNMSDWTLLTTVTAAANGTITFIDESPPPGTGFYRLIKP